MGRNISLLVPTMNNPWHLETTLRSAFKNATENGHEALVFANEAQQPTLDVVKRVADDGLPVLLVGISDKNEGVALAVNACAVAAQGEHLFYVGDDYYFLPGWDTALLRRSKPGAWVYLTPRSVERTGANPAMYAPHEFGAGEKDFRESDLLTFWKDLPKQDVVSRWGPPFMRREAWEAIGGMDVGYWPGFGTDADLAIGFGRAAQQVGADPQWVGVGDAGIYHFGCVTTSRVRTYGATLAANCRFRNRWNMDTWQFAASIGDGRPLP